MFQVNFRHISLTEKKQKAEKKRNLAAFWKVCRFWVRGLKSVIPMSFMDKCILLWLENIITIKEKEVVPLYITFHTSHITKLQLSARLWGDSCKCGETVSRVSSNQCCDYRAQADTGAVPALGTLHFLHSSRPASTNTASTHNIAQHCTQHNI